MSFLKKPEPLTQFCKENSCALAETNLITNVNVEQSITLFESCLSDKLNTFAPIRSSCKWIPKFGRFDKTKSRMSLVKGTKFRRNIITPTRKIGKGLQVNDLR